MFRKVSIPQIVEDVSNYTAARKRNEDYEKILKDLNNSVISCFYIKEIEKYTKLLKKSNSDINRYMRILEDRYLTTSSAVQTIDNITHKKRKKPLFVETDFEMPNFLN